MRTPVIVACVLVLGLVPVAATIAAPAQAARPEAATATFSNTVLWVAYARRPAAFYRDVFGFRTHVDMKLGEYLWLELETGGTKLSFMSESEADHLFGGQYRRNRSHQPPQAIGLSFRVSDTAASYAAALTAGAARVHAPKAEVWGATTARVTDPDGIVVDIIGPPTRVP